MTFKQIIVYVCFVLLFGVSSVVADDQSYLTFEYQLGFPTSSMSDFVSKVGYSGFNIDFAEQVKGNIALGGSIGWNNFYQEDERATYQSEDYENINYTAERWRQIDAMPVLFKGVYLFSREGDNITPYVSCGIGVYFMRKREILGPTGYSYSSTHFGLRPEVGAMFMFGSMGVRVSGAFNGVFNSSNQDAYDMSHWNIGVGFTFSPKGKDEKVKEQPQTDSTEAVQADAPATAVEQAEPATETTEPEEVVVPEEQVQEEPQKEVKPIDDGTLQPL